MVLDVSGYDDDESHDSDDDALHQRVSKTSTASPDQQLAMDRSLAARFISMVGAEPDRAPRPLRRLHVSQLLQMILQDAQTRLFFKAQAIIQSDIRYYAPNAKDLDYPKNLSGRRCTVISRLSWDYQTSLLRYCLCSFPELIYAQLDPWSSFYGRYLHFIASLQGQPYT